MKMYGSHNLPRIPAVGARILWYPRRLFGVGAGAKRFAVAVDILISSVAFNAVIDFLLTFCCYYVDFKLELQGFLKY